MTIPKTARPGPAIGFLQEAVRWWDHWLKGQDNGVMDEPKLRAWMPQARRPAPGYLTHPGRWLAAGRWPAPEVETRRFRLGAGTLSAAGPPASGDEAELRILGAQAAAGDLGQWGGHGDALEFPGDQRPEDGLSLSFDTAPLAEPAEILGVPVARLELAADRPLALVAVRLCDVWPDGASTLITRGLKNLTHAGGDARPEPLVPGPALPGRHPAQRDRLPGPGRAPAQAGGLADVLAVGLAVAGARDAEPVHRRLSA